MRRRSVVKAIALGSTAAVSATAGIAITAGDAEARLDVYVDKSQQQMSVIHDGALLYVWPVSTGVDRHSTPDGIYVPERLERSWFSRAYYNTPMPFAIFFHNGYAIHGSYDISQLGGPASHGCVRLHPRDAEILYSMVEREGPGNTAIYVGGDSASLPYSPYGGREGYPPGREMRPLMPPGGSASDGRYSPPQAPMSPYYPGNYGDGRGAYPPGPDAPYYDGERQGDGRAGDGRSYAYGPGIARYGDVDRYADGRAAPGAHHAAPDYGADRYADRRGVPRGSHAAPDYSADRYADGRDAPRGSRAAPDYSADRYADGRGAPRGSRAAPDYSADRYADGRGAPRGSHAAADHAPDRYPEGRVRPPLTATIRRPDDGWGAERHGPGTSPSYPAGHSDRLAMRGNYPVSQAPRPYGEVAGVPVPRHGVQPPTVAGTKPKPDVRLETRPDPRPETRPDPRPETRPGRLGDDTQGRYVTAPGETAHAPARVLAPQSGAAQALPVQRRAEPPQERPQDRTQPGIGYRVLPQSYWAGASWRWRTKREDDPR
jgi:hypothetical protein